MRIRTQFAVACSADTAWDAVHSPAVAAGLYAPLLVMSPERRFPDRFTTGDRVRVRLRLWGVVPLGSQRIVIEDSASEDGTAGGRTMHDVGRPLTGPLALLAGWHHRITILPVTARGAIWRDELTISGAFAPLCWPVFAVMWRWRRARLERRARSWEARPARLTP